MAIKLFERVESGRGLFAVETISLIYNALTSLLILLLFPRMDHPGMMLLERLGIVILTFVLIFLYQAFPCRLTAFVRMAVQMSLLAYWSLTWIIYLLMLSRYCLAVSLLLNSASSVLPYGSVNLSIWATSFIIR